MTPSMVFSITTLRYPEVEPIRVRRLTQFWDGEVTHELNELSFARVSISMSDEALRRTATYPRGNVLPLERMLHVRVSGQPDFWGMILDPEFDYTNGVVTIHAISAGWRMVRHQVRIGDQVESDGYARVDAVGVSMLRDCALNTAGQTARGVPDLGIVDGSTDVPNAAAVRMEVTRGDEVWQTMKDLTENVDNPMDIELEPQDIDEGSYAHLNTYVKQGTDRSTELKLYFGCGKRNLAAFDELPKGSETITHNHVLSQDLAHRGTAAVEGPSERFGPYVRWDALNRNTAASDPDPDATLAAIGRDTVVAYGEPPRRCTFIPGLNGEPGVGNVPTYRRDFFMGDVVRVVAKKDHCYYNEAARVRRIVIKQADAAGNTQCEVSAVPSILTGADAGSPEE